MARWLARCEREGWSRAELSRRSGHPRWKLRWWQRRFERTGRPPAKRDVAFVAVEVTEAGRGVGTIEITTPSGYHVHVPRDCDAEHLRRVVEVLERPC